MKSKSIIVGILFVGVINGIAQGFLNLNFESATIVTDNSQGFPFVFATNAIPHWTAYIGGIPQTDIAYNSVALDDPSINLEGTNSPIPSVQAIQGKYSIFLQGGSVFANSTNGASIGQTGQIPLTAQSIIYWGNSLQATFNGQPLDFLVTGSTANYTIYSADVSAYAGQTGQLLFTAPWQSSAMLDNIQFSSTAVPEPSTFALAALGGLLLGFRRWKKLR